MTYTMAKCADDYVREQLVKKGKNWKKPHGSFRFFFRVVSPKLDAEELTSEMIEGYADSRIEDGSNPLTALGDLTFIRAAMNYAKKRNRIKIVPYFPMPNGPFKERRPLAEEEYRIVMAQTMSERLRRFYLVAYWSGHRPGAIEEMKKDRVHLDTRTFDFNVPGARLTNKRRVDGFPIPDEAIPILAQWLAEPTDDPYLIGGRKIAGKWVQCSTTYHEAAHVVRVLAGLTDPKLVPRHCMRKMFVTELVERMIRTTGTADMETVGALTGDNPEMLRKHYLKIADSRLRDAANLRSKAS